MRKGTLIFAIVSLGVFAGSETWRAEQWRKTALRATDTLQACVDQLPKKGGKMEVRDNPSNSMLIFTWGGHVFLMARIPGDIPRFELPDYDTLFRAQRAYLGKGLEVPLEINPKPRRFFRVTLDRGDVPMYLEIVP